MPARHQHYGWLVSPYSAKTRAYLSWKGIPFDDIAPSALRMYFSIRKAVGKVIMPTVRTPGGSWLQDTSDIIDALELEFPSPSTVPPGPRQRLASLLLELHGDEWLPILGMHTRWTIPANEQFARAEFGRYGFPWLPGPLQQRMAKPMADKMASYLPVLGVSAETAPGIEAFGRSLIHQLDTHLSEHPYLMGGRPCLGDLSLFGPLWAHVYRDPGSRHWFDEAPAVEQWFERLLSPDPSQRGQFLPDDDVPDSLTPLFHTLFAEQFPFVEKLVDAIDGYCEAHPGATRVPRSLGNHEFTIGGHTGTRRLITFSQWMAQRPLDLYGSLDSDQRASVDEWLRHIGALEPMQLKISNPFVRREFTMGLRAPAGS
ncbi:MAG TPA: hypothetical protein DIU15_05770 [Deltaproteobacteria bacterium]|nr:hypothetical protein [Deltaproteobacteria bacterium]HCP45526.1 hypothetical protein [Deltaproteobacteria bacterium]